MGNFRLTRASFAAAVLVCTTAAFAQTPSAPAAAHPAHGGVLDRMKAMMGGGPNAWTPEQMATLEKLRDAAMTDPYALNELKHLTNNIGPRIAGSPQAQTAVEYVAAEMRALGAQVTLEKAMVPHWVRGTETGELLSWPGMAPGTKQKIVLTALGGSVATPAEGITAEVVVVDNWQELASLQAGAAKGKILLFNHKFDKELAAQGQGMYAYGNAVAYRGGAPAAGAMAGAAAVLIRSVGGADYRIPHTGMTYYPDGVEKLPAGAVTAEDADLIKDLAAQGPVTMHLTLTPQTLPDAVSYNVIADWKGSEKPDEVVIVSGHLDSWDLATGAIDDGAGIAVSMQAIHLLKELGLRPKRTVRFVAWMCEEEGSQGAAQYMIDYKDKVARHAAAIETDGGADHPTGIVYAGKPELGAWLRPLSVVLEPIGGETNHASPGTGEDIDGLTQAGVPSFAPAQDSRYYFNYHHTPADTFDKVDPKHLNENAAINAVLAYALADAETIPR